MRAHTNNNNVNVKGKQNNDIKKTARKSWNSSTAQQHNCCVPRSVCNLHLFAGMHGIQHSN